MNELKSTKLAADCAYHAAAAPHIGQVRITKIKTMRLDNVADGCLIRIDTDADITGYSEAGLPSAAARAWIAIMEPLLIGQDPLAIERHFYMMAATQYSSSLTFPRSAALISRFGTSRADQVKSAPKGFTAFKFGYGAENALGSFRGNKEKMAQGPEPAVRKSVFPVPEGPGLSLDLNEDWLRSHVAKDDTWWG